MSNANVLAIAIALIVLLSTLRLALNKTTGTIWRRVILVLLGILSALCLYFTLQPPAVWVPAAERVIESAHANTVANKPAGIALALPEAATSSATRIADLASVLRQQPSIQQLHIVGDGLPARDRDSVRGKKLQFTASPMPNGLVEFWQTEIITQGATWGVRGRVHGHNNAMLEWLNPAGVVQARAQLTHSGEFAFNQTASAPGRVLYQLRLRAKNGALLESFTVPVWVQAARSLRVQSVAGAPNAELKTLRRWLLDSGQTLRSRVDVAPDFALEGARVDLSPAGLQSTDALVLDERAWQSLSATQRSHIRAAVNAGLGLLLRVTGPLSSSTRADFQQMGIQINAAELPQAITLDSNTDALELSRQPVLVRALQSQVLLKTAQGQPLAVSKSVGQGRVAVLWLSNSYRLALAGNTPQYGHVWSALFSAIARPFERNGPVIENAPHWQGQRMVLCDLAAQASVLAGTTTVTLLPEAIGPLPGCAGYWPQKTGWQQLQSGPHRPWFYVHATEQGKALQRQQTRVATQALLANQGAASNARKQPVPGSPWPWFVAWLLASSLLWWLERRGAAKSV